MRWRTGHGLAAVLAVGLFGCSSSDEGRPVPETTTTAALPAVAEPPSRSVPVEADLVRLRGGDAATTAAALVVEPVTGSALLSFPTAGIDPECVRSAVLVVSGEVPSVRVRAWVSIETEAASMRDGESLGSSVIGGGPSAERLEGTEAGKLEWDVTELLRWSRTNQSASPSFVVVLKPAFRATSGPVELGATESGDGAILRLSEGPACLPGEA